MFILPLRHKARDGGCRKARAIGADEGLQSFGEIARRDALEVEPGDQLLDRFGLAQIRGQDGGGESLLLRLRSPIMHARHLHVHRADAGDDGTRRGVTVANDLAMAGVVEQMVTVGDPLRGFSFDGMDEHLPGSGGHDVREKIARVRR